MSTKTLLVSVLAFALMFSACSFSFSTASISSFNFGKNNTATPPVTTFDVGEKVNAVAVVSSAIGKHKVRYNLIYENVQGKSKGEQAVTKEIDLEGSGSTNFFFSPPVPGEFKVEATLIDEQGKELDKKSGLVTVKGAAPTAPVAETKTSDEDHSDSDAKPENE